jgi:ABC-type multidrug transport system ATPase subunit
MEVQAAAVDAENIWKAFGSARVLRGVSLSVPAGSAVAILGPNGSGKSTLLGVLAALIRPSRGRVRIHGEDPFTEPAARRVVGFVAHETMLYGRLSALENLRLFASLYGLPDPRARAEKACDLIGLQRRHDPIYRLSRGLEQRAALARAIVHTPQVLLLDEALTGLDPEARDRLRAYLQTFRTRGGTVIMATHSPAEALLVADHAYVLAGGRLGEPRPLSGLTAEAVQAWYLAEIPAGVPSLVP